MKATIIAAVGSVVATLAMATTAFAAEETKFSASMWLPPSHPLTKYGYEEWLNRMEELSDGTLKPRLFTGTALLSPQDHLSGVRDGVAQIGWINGSYTPSEVPEENIIFQMSFVYTDYFVGAFALTEFNMTDAQMQGQWLDNDIVYLSGYSTPPYRMICSSKISTTDEIKGKRLRSGGGALPDWAKSVGAIPVNVASSETYTGIEKGLLDCATNAIDDLRSRSYWDIAKHVTMVELGSFWTANGANREFWSDLSTEQRKVILDATAETMVDAGIGYAKDVEEIVAQAAERGVNFHEPSPELRQSIEEHQAKTHEYAAVIGAQQFGIADAGELLDRFQALARKWETLLEGVDRQDRATLVALLKREVYDKVDPATYGMQ